VLWVGIGIISLTYLICIVLNLAGVLSNIDSFGVVALTLNFIYDSIVTVMVTLAIIKISKISKMLPRHIKHNKVMIWSHIVLFNLFSLIEVVVVVFDWLVLATSSDRELSLISVKTWMVCGIFVQLLIAKVIVMFSKSTEDTKEIWSCVMDQDIGHIRNDRETLLAWNQLMED